MHLQVGLVACNDYIILESCIYRILKKHFAGKSYYPLLLDFFHEVGCPSEMINQHPSPVITSYTKRILCMERTNSLSQLGSCLPCALNCRWTLQLRPSSLCNCP